MRDPFYVEKEARKLSKNGPIVGVLFNSFQRIALKESGVFPVNTGKNAPKNNESDPHNGGVLFVSLEANM